MQRSVEAQALMRARRCGWLTERAADRLAAYVVRMSMWELWPDAG
ncbi:hypothetical protein QWY28_21815 [Nocardioides sp. SOB77]|uniref:Uncharacterized protein n=1 Tax=Nocardioides oceani TaxID=3058369 RepID=A0ABT8FM51_9ACTN|nr:hypothetical protein [Nocardioides oceani]MDN4175614.1 hypothetical protein [Nocardioides oceani]